ncbi:MAG: DUF4804 domain-containing protein [Gammaproteobacteria bacterium]|nr:DUF4804 domain-containing protein [Gammaproteobacteria bacterium]MCW5582757.1 DUF4804 domain-containing protein [Gammaproteobacteria bacterium]
MSDSRNDPLKPTPTTYLERAKRAKEEIKSLLEEFNSLKPNSTRQDPFHHPIAVFANNRFSLLSEETQNLITQCEGSASLMILEEHLPILQSFYESRKKINDNLGNLYKTISFAGFILRLFHKRYKEVYMDGRAVVGREPKTKIHIQDRTGESGREFLDSVGSSKDKSHFFEEYLTLEEMVLSPLVLPQVTSIVIGTGNRSKEEKWNIAEEFNESIDIATFSYPAAAEFRDGRTAHYDLLFITKPDRYSHEQEKRVARLQANQPLLEAAKVIYGQAFDTHSKINTKDDTYLVELKTHHNETYYSNKKAYVTRTKHVLKLVLLSADIGMAEKGLGTTLQLKGLGLGAFAFTGEGASATLESLYIESLKEVLQECKLQHIKQINLINLPTTFGTLGTAKQDVCSIGNISVFRTDMEPTSAAREKQIESIGGTVFCGDSGSAVGNEGNIGLVRSSSDDPATQYSLLNPLILNPEHNPVLTNENCIRVIMNQNKVLTLSEYQSEYYTATIAKEAKEKPSTGKVSSSHGSAATSPGLFASKESGETKVKIYKTKGGELAIEGPTKQIHEFCDVLCRFGIQIRLGKERGNTSTLLIKSSQGKGTCGTYIAKNQEVAIAFSQSHAVQIFIALLSLNHPGVQYRDNVVYFPLSLNTPGKYIETTLQPLPAARTLRH